MKILIFCIVLITVLVNSICLQETTDNVIAKLKNKILPLPKTFTKYAENSNEIYLDEDTLNYKFVQDIKCSKVKDYMKIMFKEFKDSMFQEYELSSAQINKKQKSSKNDNFTPITINFWIKNYANTDFETQSINTNESYELIIASRNFIFLSAENYFGLIRGLQTFALLLTQKDENFYINDGYIIKDEPNYQYRGLLLDTSRHFMEMDSIKKALDSMMMNKMNVLHWHIVDSESFPLYIEEIPELSKYGAYDSKQIYSKDDVSEIIKYAEQRAIRIIPEIDTPAHTGSWGRSDKYKALMACPDCDWDVCSNGPPQGTLNPTLDQTYTVVKKVMKQIVSQFKDSFIHLGGDEVIDECWKINKQITQWLTEHPDIKDYGELQNYYQNKQRDMLTELNSKKQAIYWFKNENLKLKDGDIIQYWGKFSDTAKYLKNFPNNYYILSPYDKTYLDCGKGNKLGKNSWCIFNPIKHLFAVNPKMEDLAKPELQKNVLGGEACLWTNQARSSTIDSQIWQRTSVFAERFWNNDFYEQFIDGKSYSEQNIYIREIIQRTTALGIYMSKNGIEATPITSEYCSREPSKCWLS